MLLYHFTSGNALRGIARHGLTVGDVPTDIRKMTGRVGVWLTSSPDTEGHGLGSGHLDKKRMRLTVEVPENASALVRWSEWSGTNATAETRELIERADGASASTWYVYFGHIPADWIKRVEDLHTGQAVADWEVFWPATDSRPGVPYWRRENWQKKMLKGVKRALRGS